MFCIIYNFFAYLSHFETKVIVERQGNYAKEFVFRCLMLAKRTEILLTLFFIRSWVKVSIKNKFHRRNKTLFQWKYLNRIMIKWTMLIHNEKKYSELNVNYFSSFQYTTQNNYKGKKRKLMIIAFLPREITLVF